MSGLRRLCLAFVVMLAAGTAAAVQPDEVLKDPALEARARQISEGLRCLVCQNQSIDDSDAPLAKDLRVLVRDRLSAGATDRQVVDFVVQRYGEFVLLKPLFGWHTLLLWLSPLIVMALGVVGIWQLVKRRERPNEPVALTQAEREEVEELLHRK